MKTARNIVATLALLPAGGCLTATIAPDSPCAAIPAAFSARLAPRFEQVNAVVFHFRWRRMTALGVASVDRPQRSFNVSCMTPLGVKLFDVICRNGQLADSFVHPALAQLGGNLAAAAGADLSHAYLDLAPPETAAIRRQGRRLVCSAPDDDGATVFHYDMASGALLEKSRLAHGRRLWRVTYREFHRDIDGLVPQSIIIDNYQYKYRIAVTTRSAPEA